MNVWHGGTVSHANVLHAPAEDLALVDAVKKVVRAQVGLELRQVNLVAEQPVVEKRL